jgi:hypothetical protein
MNSSPFEIIGTSNNNIADFSLNSPIVTKQATLSNGTEVTVIVPGGVNRAFYAYNSPNVLVGNGTVAMSINTTSAFQDVASNGELCPPQRQVNPGDTLRFLTNDASAWVQISFRGGN